MTVVPFQRSRFVVPHPRPWLEGVVYDERTRDHTADGRRVLSVTQILALAGKTDYSRIRTETLYRKGRIGTAAHLAAHFFDEGDLIEASVDPVVAPYIDAWRLFREQRRFVPECLETVVFSREYGYIGRLDRVGLVDGRRRILIDIKTGDPDAARADLQEVAYELALIEEFPEFGVTLLPRWSVQLFPSCKYRVVEYPKSPRTWRHDRAEWLDALHDAHVLAGITWSAPRMSTTSLFDVSREDAQPPPRTDDGPPPPLSRDEPPPPLPATDEPPPPRQPIDARAHLGDGPGAAAELLPPEPLPPEPMLPPTIVDPADKSLVAALVQQNAAIVVRARALAAAVQDKPSAQAAIDYATRLDDEIRDATAKIEGPKKRAYQPYLDWLNIERAIIGPREQAKAILTGKEGAVTKWIAAERERAAARARDEQAARDRDAAERRQREEAERQRLEAEARAAREAGDRERAAEASRQAVEAEQRRDAVTADVVPIESPTEGLTGATPKKRMVWEFVAPASAPRGLIGDQLTAAATLEFVKAIACPHVLRDVITAIKDVPEWQTASPEELLHLLDHMADTAVQIPIAAVSVDAKYLTRRATADGATLKWPGIKFVDAGSTALAPRNRRAR